jgi:hypothetical protein
VACAFFELVDNGEPWRCGFWIACIALTKNEGLPLALLLLAAAAIVWRRRMAAALIAPAIAIAHLFFWRARIDRSDEEDFMRTLFDLPAHLERFAGALAHFVMTVADLRHWGLVMVMIAVAFFFARGQRVLAAMIVVPMVLLYAAAVAVAPWEIDGMADNVPRLLTHLLGPMFVVLRDAVQRDTAAAPPRA